MTISEYSLLDLCEVIKIEIDARNFNRAQELLDRIKLINSSISNSHSNHFNSTISSGSSKS